MCIPLSEHAMAWKDIGGVDSVLRFIVASMVILAFILSVRTV